MPIKILSRHQSETPGSSLQLLEVYDAFIHEDVLNQLFCNVGNSFMKRLAHHRLRNTKKKILLKTPFMKLYAITMHQQALSIT